MNTEEFLADFEPDEEEVPKSEEKEKPKTFVLFHFTKETVNNVENLPSHYIGVRRFPFPFHPIPVSVRFRSGICTELEAVCPHRWLNLV